MSIWYALCEAMHLEFLHMTFMKNALLAVLILAPLFGLLSTMIVTGRMSFSPTHSATRALPALLSAFFCGRGAAEVGRYDHRCVFSSTAVALGIFIATLGGSSFTKFNKYLIGDILSVTPGEIGRLALVLLGVALLWVFAANRLFLTAVHPQLASSRGIPTEKTQALFTVCIAVVVTLAMSWVGLMVINSLSCSPAASSRNIARNLREYHLFFRPWRAVLLDWRPCDRVLSWLLGRRDDCAVSRALFYRYLLLPQHAAVDSDKNIPAFLQFFKLHVGAMPTSTQGQFEFAGDFRKSGTFCRINVRSRSLVPTSNA